MKGNGLTSMCAFLLFFSHRPVLQFYFAVVCGSTKSCHLMQEGRLTFFADVVNGPKLEHGPAANAQGR